MQFAHAAVRHIILTWIVFWWRLCVVIVHVIIQNDIIFIEKSNFTSATQKFGRLHDFGWQL
jgi:hypothetical protein